MAIFKQDKNSCYFIHIPRTAGRYVTALFETTKNKKVSCFHHRLGEERYQGVDSIHLHYPLYLNHLNVENIPHITVVRNPISKFESCVRYMYHLHNIEYKDLLKSKEIFNLFMETEINHYSFHNNWFLPQHKFISPKTFIWKYESGFGENFKKWIYEKTNIEIETERVEYQKILKENNEKYELCKVIKTYIKDYYKDDFKIFKY